MPTKPPPQYIFDLAPVLQLDAATKLQLINALLTVQRDFYSNSNTRLLFLLIERLSGLVRGAMTVAQISAQMNNHRTFFYKMLTSQLNKLVTSQDDHRIRYHLGLLVAKPPTT